MTLRQNGLMIALLAAGQSQRFGTADKLSADLNGTMLGLHASETLAALPADQRIVIASNEEHACAGGWRARGFEIALNPDADQGMGTSVALAAKLAVEAQAETLLIALADMPFVPLEHFRALAAQATASTIAASHNGTARTPPAVFGKEHFATLMQVTGHRGAGALLSEAKIISCRPDQLTDIDTLDDLKRLTR